MAFPDGHVSAFAFPGRVPRPILHDNTTLAVARIPVTGTRRCTQAFTHQQSHYLFRDRFGRPGKGKVEVLVKTARRRFRRCTSCRSRTSGRWHGCLKRLDALEAGERATATPCAICRPACEHMPGQVSSTALVRYRLVDNSAPAVHAHRKVMVKRCVDRIGIAPGAEIAVRHRRSHSRGDVIHDPLHYLSLLEERPGALDQAPPLQGWKLDPAFDTLHRRRHLCLLEDFPEPQVTAAVQDAGGTSPDRLRWREAFPGDPHRETARASRPRALPAPAQPFVATTQAAECATLLAMAEATRILFEHHLKLPTFLREYGKPARQCAAEDLDQVQFLARMVKMEMIDRERRIRQARFRVVKQLESVDFKAVPSFDKMLVPDLASGDDIERRENAILLGPGGAGRRMSRSPSCRKGLCVRFTTVSHPVHEMIGAHDKKDCSASRPGSPG